MQKLTWDELVLAVQTTPKEAEPLPDYISMKGALDINVNGNQPVPERLFEITSDIERKFRESFLNLAIVGEETLNVENPVHPPTRYIGQVYGSDKTGVILRMQITSTTPRQGTFSNMAMMPSFYAVFPLGEYHQQTNLALSGIWSYIHGFDYVFPGEAKRIQEDRRGDQSVLFVRGGMPVASGQHAFREARIPVQQKKTILMESGIRI